MLAVSILSKGFPGLLLVLLLLQRRWRALFWTGGFMTGITLVSLLILGPEPFIAFFRFHLPRVQSGEAFAFVEAWPDLKVELLAGNVSVYALIQKLGELGLPGMTESTAKFFHGMFSLFTLGIAVLAARINAPQHRALAWLAVLNLAAMTSLAAWGDYVPLGSLWALTLLVGRGFSVGRPLKIFLAACWVFCFLLPGVMPLVKPLPAPITLMLSVLGTALLIGFNGWLVTWLGRAPRPALAEIPA